MKLQNKTFENLISLFNFVEGDELLHLNDIIYIEKSIIKFNLISNLPIFLDYLYYFNSEYTEKISKIYSLKTRIICDNFNVIKKISLAGIRHNFKEYGRWIKKYNY